MVNSLIAKNDIKLAKKLKKLAKSELERSKARNLLVKKDKKFTKLRREVAVDIKDFVEKKLEIRKNGVLKFSEDELKKEITKSIYNGKMAIFQEALNDLYLKIADIDKIIAQKRQKYAINALDLAKEREQLSKKLLIYIKTVRENLPEEQVLKAKRECENIKKKLLLEKKELLEKEGEIKRKENELVDLEREVGLKFSELEKIRPACTEN